MLMHSIKAFFEAIHGVTLVLVLPVNQFDYWRSLCDIAGFSIPHVLAEGGETRFDSVKNGLALLDKEELVAIHDGARPLIQAGLIQRSFRAAQLTGNSVPAIPVTESLRTVEGACSQPADRSRIRIIQTPQVFRLSELKEAYKQDYCLEYTDDATVMERMGTKVNLIDGDPGNIKITHPSDLIIAEALLRKLKASTAQPPPFPGVTD